MLNFLGAIRETLDLYDVASQLHDYDWETYQNEPILTSREHAKWQAYLDASHAKLLEYLDYIEAVWDFHVDYYRLE